MLVRNPIIQEIGNAKFPRKYQTNQTQSPIKNKRYTSTSNSGDFLGSWLFCFAQEAGKLSVRQENIYHRESYKGHCQNEVDPEGGW